MSWSVERVGTRAAVAAAVAADFDKCAACYAGQEEEQDVLAAKVRALSAIEGITIEPYANGIRALAVPSTAITDYAKVCDKFAELIVARGEIALSTKVTGLKRNPQEVIVQTDRGEFVAKAIINCAGLFERLS